ncbi:MAG TPA: tetratricopeptide repeat protein, partial [Gemmatimonadales bacterium]|nr:tetratricopeptide repeat protein [Gemmatimonadales bacterium]
MNLEKLKDTARKHEQREDWRKAIDAYQRVIQHYDSGREADADLTVYNRVGDLHLKLNDPGSAVQSYERAAELYAEQGFLNNAIALCGKMLRVNPGRVQVYLQLAHLHARKNVVSEAKRNLIEYMERMNTLGRLDEAFGQLKSFADQHSANQDIRMMLVELLRAASRTEEAQEQLERIASELEARGDRAGARKTRERIHTIDSADDAEPASGNDLIFLETGFEPPHLSSRRNSAPSAAPPAPAPPPEPEPTPAPLEGLDTFEPPVIAA